MAKIIRKQQRQPLSRMTEIGRLYKGKPSGTSNKGRYQGGDDYASHYIRFEPADRFKNQPSTGDYANLHDELKAKWEKLIAEGSVLVQFPSDNPGDVFSWENKVIKAVKKGSDFKATYFQCDGTTCTKWVEYPKDGPPQFKSGARPCFAGPDDAECPKECKPKGMLKLFVPELHPGLIVFPINSPVDVTAIEDYLNTFVQQGIRLSGGLFRLFRKADDISWLENKERKSKQNWGLHLEVDPTIAQIFLQSQTNSYRQQLMGGASPALKGDQPLALSAAILEEYHTSQQFFDFQNRITAAAQAGDRQAIEQLANEEKRTISASNFDASAYRFIDIELNRGLDMLRSQSVLPPASPATIDRTQADALKAEATSAGYSTEGFQALYKSFGVDRLGQLTLEQFPQIMAAAQDKAKAAFWEAKVKAPA